MAVELYLQDNILKMKNFENLLPDMWQHQDFENFSDNKKLYDYQQDALKNALYALYWFYSEDECNGDKSECYSIYKFAGFKREHLFNVNSHRKYEILKEYNEFEIDAEGNFHIKNFINRMSFWMATGSGKTLVIIKLIEILTRLIKERLIPQNEILFLTYRDDLIEQFKRHVDEYNSFINKPFRINLHELKEYENIRYNKGNYLFSSLNPNEIDVFYYRSDLVDIEQKEKRIDFRNYDNNGKWFIILDEAHKGDKEDSKRQLYYLILARNGFLFNFSATFTDELDYATCVYNFNLQKFIENGYGKHIYLSPVGVSELGEKDIKEKDKAKIQREKLTLIFLLLAYLKKLHKNIGINHYHSPLMMTLVNSVNTEDADLKLFFQFLSEFVSCKFAYNLNSDELIENAKDRLKNELHGDTKLQLENLNLFIDTTKIANLTYNDILQEVFNTNKCGSIEIIKMPQNKQELLLKAKNSDRPFALIKIGDISEWLKSLSTEQYEIYEKPESEKIFTNLNQDKDINLLIGSRAFYEGWDSPRPNIILYINIGTNIDAKKFILQSIGRGVRIQPVYNFRKRLEYLQDNLMKLNKDDVMGIETLFIYGTKKDAVEKIIETLEEEKQSEYVEGFKINPDIEDKILLVPVYTFIPKQHCNFNVKIQISNKDISLLQSYFNYLGEKVFLFKHNVSLHELKFFKSIVEKPSKFIASNSKQKEIGNINVIVSKIAQYASLKYCILEAKHPFREIDKDKDIVHFKRISVSSNDFRKIKSLVDDVLEKKQSRKFKKDKDIISINYIQNHYYIPVCLSESERITFIKHIIKTKSEVDFINALEKYCKAKDNFFNKYFEWWYFSKIDETMDNIYIPYYETIPTKVLKFKPDFIFWMKKKNSNDYYIVFVDPKSLGARDQEYKVEGYKKLFRNSKDSGKPVEFKYQNFNIYVFLFLYNKNAVSSSVSDCWVKSISEMMTNVLKNKSYCSKLF